MQTLFQNINERVMSLVQDVEVLLNKHSRLLKMDSGGYGLLIVRVDGDYKYGKLDEVGRRLQSKIISEFNKLESLLLVILREQAKESQRNLEKHLQKIRRTIEHECTHKASIEDVVHEVNVAALKIVELTRSLYASSSDITILVPDTNALVFNPNIEAWKIPGSDIFKVVVVPVVFMELDQLKITHRNEDVRNKANKLIRKFQEYRRRGRLTDGVPIIKDKMYLQALAVEPDLDNSLPWLDKNNDDDRFIASAIEVFRKNPASPVTLLTSDINLQNKAEYAYIPCESPPASI